MRSKWTISLGLIICLGIALFVVSEFYLDPWLKTQIEQQVNGRVNGHFTVKNVGVSLLPPLGIKMEKIQLVLNKPAMTFTADAIRARATLSGLLSRRFNVNLALNHALVVINKPAPEVPQARTQIQSGPSLALQSQLPVQADINLVVRNSEVVIKDSSGKTEVAKLNILGMSFQGSDVRGPWNLKMNSELTAHVAGTEFKTPLEVETSFSRQENVLQTDKTFVNVAGLLAAIRGQTDLAKGTQDWSIVANIPHIENLKAPPQFLPPGHWTGSISTRIRTVKPENRAWEASGTVQLKDIYGDVKYSKGDTSLIGQLTSDGQVDFTYENQLVIPQFNFRAQLEQIGVRYGRYFSKPVGVPMAVTFNGTMTNNTLTLNNFKFVLANLQAFAQGTVQTSKQSASNIRISIPTTNLAGWEKYFPMLARSPIQGTVQLNATAQGNLADPKTAKISVAPLIVKNARATIDWTDPSKKLRVQGPVQVNATVNAVAQGQQLKYAQVRVQGQFTSLGINAPNLLVKPAGQLLAVNVAAQQRGPSLNISQGILRTPAGMISLTGAVRNWQSPILALKIKAPKINLKSAGELLPMLASYRLDGSLSSGFSVKGTYNFKKGLSQSPLDVSGTVHAHLHDYTYSGASPSGPQSRLQAKAVAPKPTALLPNWPVLRSAQVQSQILIDTVHYKDLLIEGVSWKGNLNRGFLTGQASVKRLFDGSVQARFISTSLVQIEPTTVANVQFHNVNIGEGVNWALPDWKNQVGGLATGSSEITIPYPSRPDFLQQLRTLGQLHIINGKLSSLKFQQLANAKLSQIPGIGNRANVRMDDVRADISTDYSLANRRVALSHFQMKTPDNDELVAQGWLGLDKQVDLSGTAYLANAPVSGSIREANSDSKGRLVLPLLIRGNIMQPDVGFAQETIHKLLANTAKYEGKKLTEKIRKQGTDALKKQGEDLLKNLGDSVNGLFGH